MALLVVASELEEVIGLCDRCLVIADGRIVDEFDRGEGERGAGAARHRGRAGGQPAAPRLAGCAHDRVMLAGKPCLGHRRRDRHRPGDGGVSRCARAPASSAPGWTATRAGRLAQPTRRKAQLLVSAKPTSRSEADVRAAVAEAVERFGGLDAVVNCAGIYPTGKRLEEVTDEEWDRTIAVNLTAIFRVCRATLPLLRAAGGGSIVNIASVHARRHRSRRAGLCGHQGGGRRPVAADGARLCGRPHPRQRACWSARSPPG